MRSRTFWTTQSTYGDTNKERNSIPPLMELQAQHTNDPFRDPFESQQTLLSTKKENLAPLRNVNSSALKLRTRRCNNSDATVKIAVSGKQENFPKKNVNANEENFYVERFSRNSTTRTNLAVESLSTVLKRVNEESCIHSGATDQKHTMDEIERLKVVELRQELKKYGVESKHYSKLRKAELVSMVFEQRNAQTSTYY